VLALALCVSCNEKSQPQVVVLHVLRDPSAQFAEKLRQADSQFALTKLRLADGRSLVVATNEGNSYPTLIQQIVEMPPDLLFEDSESDVSAEALVHAQLAEAGSVCGTKLVYVTNASGEKSEAAQIYLRFLRAHCD
jgi:hypothetical protein